MKFEELAYIWRGFQESRVILTAVELGLFNRLTKPKTVKQTARYLKTSLRGTEILLKALVAVKVIKKSGQTYVNSAMANRHFVESSPEYYGDLIKWHASTWQGWSNLTEVVKTGKPLPRPKDPKALESLIMGMHNLSIKRAPELVSAIGMEGVTHALDLGGGPGTNAIEMARQMARHTVRDKDKPGKVTLFDYPETLKIARRIARADGKGVRLNYKGGDFTTGPIGNDYDLILVSQIYHTYPEDASIALTSKCYDALLPGGRIAVQELPIERDKTSPVGSALFTVNMLVGTSGGNMYHSSEIGGWLRQSGFKQVKVTRLSATVLITAKKPLRG